MARRIQRIKKANRPVGFPAGITLLGVVRVFIFAAVAFSTVTVQVQAVVGQADTVTVGNFTLTRFDRVIAEFDHFATIEANQVIVMMLLRQFENGFTAFKIMAGNNAGIIKLVQYAINGSQTDLFPHVDQAFV